MSEEFTPERLAHIEYELNCMRAELKELKDKNAILIEENKLMRTTVERQTAYVNGIMDARPRMSNQPLTAERLKNGMKYLDSSNETKYGNNRKSDRKSSWLDDAVTTSTIFSSSDSGFCGGGGGSSSSW